mgnify:CR=1 FL=1
MHTITKASRLRSFSWIAFSLLLAFLAQSCSPYDTTAVTPFGKKANVPLPDGSFIDLNAGSTLRYNASDFTEKRIVELEGEAYFLVKRGGGFLCKTPYGLVRVIGTSFNVYARPDGFSVSCYLGKVEVRHQGDIMELQLNEKAIWQEDHFEKVPEYAERPAWIKGETIFKAAAYTSVLSALERQFNLEVNAEITGNPPFTGSFPHDDLQQAMDNIVDPFGYRYAQNGRQMRIWEP